MGELRIVGLVDDAAQARLRAEADLISQLIQSTQNLHVVTSELIDTQDQLLAMYDLTEAMRDYLDLNKVLEQLAREVARLVKVEATFVIIQKSDESWLIKQYPQPMMDLTSLRSMIDIVRVTGHEYLLNEEDAASQVVNCRNFLMMPIKLRGDMLAAIGLINKVNGQFLSPDIKLTRAIAEQAGARIENAFLYQENLEKTKLQTEMELAHRVQLNLLPRRLPAVKGLDLWSDSRPALQVGGDFYDYFYRDGRPFTFTVGDISGKGLPAALLMAMTRTVIRAKANDMPTPTPEIVVGRSNEELYDDFTDVNMFATVFVGQYNSAKRELLYANAGHSPVIFCPSGGKAQLLEADGTPVGILPTSLSRDQKLILQPGDLLVVATDGLSEAHNTKDEMFGYERLLHLTQSLAEKPAREIGQVLSHTIQEFSSGKQQDDDQTLIVLKGVRS
ncbi:MAG: PP2C family protein-serine/threonine phosphatase [Ardenticatenaceae bacterium]|nr:PP2C family protein-serine/threonine phosphatase [Ardenticatenaceae bacterium]MCB9442649.1 PP2C family protein-serine/threonine phosphatase [Ardenticatenaceae bacterium]